MRRWAEIGEVADTAMFLSSASAYITGAIIDVDGGTQLGDASRNSLDKGLA
jgi:NAD(P)-dependent dehydrogenase (short-subunit alcohol dehydrogenase family)